MSIETAQTKVNYDADMNVTSDLSAPGKTKKELETITACAGHLP